MNKDVFVEYLKDNPVPSTEFNESHMKQYIEPHIWEGSLKVDGGFGNLKVRINDMIPGDLKTVKLPFSLKASLGWDETDEFIADLETHLETGSDDDREEYYDISFPGEQYALLFHVIEYIQKMGAKQQEYDLISYPSTLSPKIGDRVFRLKIQVNEDKVYMSLRECPWVVDEKNTNPVAGWIEGLKI